VLGRPPPPEPAENKGYFKDPGTIHLSLILLNKIGQTFFPLFFLYFNFYKYYFEYYYFF
jgi:hypothetical protein